MNDENKKTEKVLDAISALKQKVEDDIIKSEAKEGVDLEAIVKKLSQKREKLSKK